MQPCFGIRKLRKILIRKMQNMAFFAHQIIRPHFEFKNTLLQLRRSAKSSWESVRCSPRAFCQQSDYEQIKGETVKQPGATYH